jgi:urocanate hydratase
MASSDMQQQAMHIYQALTQLREDWGGGLVLLCGPGCVDSGAAAAVSIAGGATLAIDADAAAMKAAMRAGYLDFVVNTLDEALRALKNEVRKRRPLGVGLIADVDATLAEMVERGVQPDLHVVAEGTMGVDTAHLDVLRGRGMEACVSLAAAPVTREGRHECFLSVANAAELGAVDASLLVVIGENDLVRRRWIQRVPQYLREARCGGRWIWLSDEEREQMRAQGLLGEGEQTRP